MQALYDFIAGTINTVAWIYILLPCVFVGGLYYTIGSGGVQFRRFGYAMKNTFGKIFKKTDAGVGEVTPLQAVCTALAGTVGTGNIVGTSQAIALGGYGAIFWLWLAALLGMVIKYAEVTLSIRYREKDTKGDWVGGPMYYIKNGLGQKWAWLAILFCTFAVLASFGIGNMSQANSINDSIKGAIAAFAPDFANVAAVDWVIGIALALLTAGVLFGGIKRIGSVTERLVPIMSIVYIIFTLVVIFGNIDMVGEAFRKIFIAAFNPQAVVGAGSGILLKNAIVWGLRRSAFSNEAGLGSAPIAHAAANCEGPVQQGVFGIFEVFADTIVICTLTALVILVSGVPVNYGAAAGAELTISGFTSTYGNWISVFTAVAMCCFAFSTIIGWGLYGARCIEFLFSEKVVKPFMIAYSLVAIIGATVDLGLLWSIAETFNGLMAIPNLIGIFLLSGTAIALTKEYFAKK